MKKIVLLITALLLVCGGAYAQSNVFNRLKNRAKNAAEQNIGNKVEKGVNDVLNGNININHGNQQQTQQQEPPVEEESMNQHQDDGTWTCPVCGHEGNTGKFCEECGAPRPDGNKKAEKEKPAETAYAKSDFVPGDEIFFEDDFANEQLGEFPSRWDLLDGYAEVVSIAGRKCIGFTDDGNGEVWPLMEKQKDFLPDVFTLEFDTYISGRNELDEHEVGEQKLWVIFNSSKKNGEVARICFWWRTGDGGCNISWDALNPSSDNWVNGNKDMYVGNNGEYESKSLIKLGSWNHFAVSFNKRAFKVYVNGTRVANLPNVMAPTWLEFHHQGDYKYSSISNVRLAQGAVPLYDRLTSTGKIVTYAITFDTGKATLKPEADLEINRIKGIMEQDPSIRFEVQGHCDNTGSDAVNDKLSQQRAEAIVARLVEFGIDASRLTAVGKGAHEPIADNGTDEGRAKNRRVEFVNKK